MSKKRVYVHALVGSILLGATAIFAAVDVGGGAFVRSGSFGQLCVLAVLGVVQLEHFNEGKKTGQGWARYFLMASSWMTMALVVGAFVAMFRDPKFFEPMWYGAISFCCVALGVEGLAWGWPSSLIEVSEQTGAGERA
jgi:hypothetical protein